MKRSISASTLARLLLAVAVAGRRVAHVYTSSEPGPRHALRVAAISNDRWLGVGFCVDADAVPDVEILADSAPDAWEARRGSG